MNLDWNLDELYTSIDSQEFTNDFENFKKEIDKINLWIVENLKETKNATKKIEEYIILKNRIGYYDMLYIYVNLRLSTDTTNEKISKILDILEELSVETTTQDASFKHFLKNIENLDEIINSSHILKEHEYIIKEMKIKSEYMLSKEEETLIAKMENTGSKMWKKLWEQSTSTLSVDITIDKDKKSLPLSAVRNFAHSFDKDLRKNAYECELKSYEKISTSCAFALNGIKGEVLNTSKMRGYESPLDMTILDSRIDDKILKAMLEAIEEGIPKFEKYFIKKAEILVNNNGLPFYDIFAPIGKTDMCFTYEQAKDFIIKNFSDFSKKLGDFAENAFNSSWIDSKPKSGKMGGAFCESIHSIKQSRILTNFSGTFDDVITIAHELGHAYHDSCIYNETSLNSSYPMPIAETASTFCETIITNSALKSASKEESLIIIENDISGIAQVIVDIYSRFLFESAVFEQRKKGSLSVKELNDIMMESQIKAYGKGLDNKYLHKYMWICKPHYYDAEYNYYNFPYAFGLLLCKGLYSLYIKNNDNFVKSYDKMLSQTSKNNIADAVKIFGIDLHDKNFWLESIDIIDKEIIKFINM